MKQHKMLVITLVLGCITILTACHKSNHFQSSNEKSTSKIINNSSLNRSSFTEKDSLSISINNSSKKGISSRLTNNNYETNKIIKHSTISNNQQTNHVINNQVQPQNTYSKTNANNQQVNLTNATMAENYLKQKLNLTSNNIYAENNSKFNGNDNLGKFYTIELVDISQRLAGKTGLIGYYKVYQLINPYKC